ncbi:hypothetical protein CHH70_09560 [Shouchella clausii]|nr:hypothetical protein CHH73_05180 [Shouchella clausii]PAD90882.1 hypothetical protein CHH52_17365 [Shouchella clausii]PAE94029.1 hypothetical protein CHH70_09560 [Shouchella clausii]
MMKASAQGVYVIQLEDRIEKSGIKWTKQRTAIIHAFMEKGAGLLTAEEVFLLTKSHLPKLGMATVYRTLELCVEARLLRKIFNDRTARYCLCPFEMNGNRT